MKIFLISLLIYFSVSFSVFSQEQNQIKADIKLLKSGTPKEKSEAMQRLATQGASAKKTLAKLIKIMKNKKEEFSLKIQAIKIL